MNQSVIEAQILQMKCEEIKNTPERVDHFNSIIENLEQIKQSISQGNANLLFEKPENLKKLLLQMKENVKLSSDEISKDEKPLKGE